MLIALALDFVPNGNDRAVSHAERAKKVLLLKLDELERVKEEDRDDKAKREIEDIKGLMGDVDMKVGVCLIHYRRLPRSRRRPSLLKRPGPLNQPASAQPRKRLTPTRPASLPIPFTDRRPPHRPRRARTHRLRHRPRSLPAAIDRGPPRGRRRR